MNPISEPSNNKGFILIFFLLIIQALLYHVIPPLVFKISNNPDINRKILWYFSNEWASAWANEFSTWVNTDGTSDKDVSPLALPNGVQIINNSPEFFIREAYFLKDYHAGDIFKLSVDITTNKSSSFGLVFRGDAEGQFYVFIVSDFDYTVEFLPRENNFDLFRQSLIEITPLPDQINRVNEISVLGYGNSYSLYINDIYVDKFTDTRLQGDMIGIEMFTCDKTLLDETTNIYWNYSFQQPVQNY